MHEATGAVQPATLIDTFIHGPHHILVYKGVASHKAAFRFFFLNNLTFGPLSSRVDLKFPRQKMFGLKFSQNNGV